MIYWSPYWSPLNPPNIRLILAAPFGLIICLIKVIMAYADVLHGHMHQKGRLDVAAKAATIRYVAELIVYIGGLIITGMGVATDALIQRTAQLPKIDFELPPNIIGRNTIDCMKSGALYSNACALDGIISRIENELGEKCTAVATGGLAEVVVPLCNKEIILDKNLLIKGLSIIYRKNKKK